MSYSYDLRKRVEAYVLGGGKKTEAAQLFRVHVQTIHNWMRMKGGVCSAGKPGPRPDEPSSVCPRNAQEIVKIWCGSSGFDGYLGNVGLIAAVATIAIRGGALVLNDRCLVLNDPCLAFYRR